MSSVWRVAEVVDGMPENATARTIRLRVAGLMGHLAGQHIDVRLTADDGYSAIRSYSVSSASPDEHLDITVDELPDGEVSPYLVRDLAVGDQLEIRGPVGGWFVWRPDRVNAVQLIGGGSGVVPLMSMIRAHQASDNESAFRLLYSLKSPETSLYVEELHRLDQESAKLTVDYIYTRSTPEGWPAGPARLTSDTLLGRILPVEASPDVFVCGQTVFVETVADWLVTAGYSPESIKTERFGGTGGIR
ncbi:ferredoxin reductase [Paenarthrobacter nitroguajacolicus]|uniref:ferredoxin reductase n=1 Tax=Paenarthrobacter nitroguajacolicus TaxID=211146 RepID=UPI00248CE4BC|nr:ferredoxin reductase [Paenarthrobacter nitroguajacolicus]MDI2036263.1 Naphthalene 1,2-dioxygenase/salicylate 5-hydroxylase system, ferredoxin--NAD(P)(+), reductase component [Paenarthrobacter nitroguajacolicus]